ncbi:hypothetical protein HER32_09150 [Hymenobacter sp. BT18]|uniref:hypothetical protein n=1 Tax=Hymenobacter sp. BT18 TaxID=2835648 RepID=UPI00143E8A8B|nr:hypothetical protein [Hymenobacter sp. BT18]QIX61338.1 hypothetical protein HER32_09150 [Hymenobacter sp. BT18]
MLLLPAGFALGQTASAAPSEVPPVLRTLRQHYEAGLDFDSQLYNGQEYVNYVRSYIKGHAFFDSADPQPGTVEYGGGTYSVPLRYDIVREVLVLKAPLGALTLQLINERVTRFSLGSHSFIRLVADSSRAAPIRTGFYEVLIDGSVQLLAAHRKNLQQRSVAGGMEGEITQKDEFFVRQGTELHSVGKAKSVLALFPESKARLREYIKTRKLQFSSTRRQEALTALLQYYATLPVPSSPARH